MRRKRSRPGAASSSASALMTRSSASFELWQTEVRDGGHAYAEEDALANRAWGMVRRVNFRQNNNRCR